MDSIKGLILRLEVVASLSYTGEILVFKLGYVPIAATF
jgi:hypothetical protein